MNQENIIMAKAGIHFINQKVMDTAIAGLTQKISMSTLC